jgi:hypothetical protein
MSSVTVNPFGWALQGLGKVSDFKRSARAGDQLSPGFALLTALSHCEYNSIILRTPRVGAKDKSSLIRSAARPGGALRWHSLRGCRSPAK